MDRRIVYPYEQLADADLLILNKSAYIALSKVASAILGTSTAFDGFACTPTIPASLSVEVAAGTILSLQNIDNTAYGSIPADTTHQILKTGINLDKVTLSCPAPGTAGFSINYLIQIAFSETDTDNGSRQFKDPSTGAITTIAKNQTRADAATIAVKSGTAATTGTQTTPAPDAGYTGAYVVTVANGQTTITSGDISVYSGAPFINDKLKDKITQAQGDARYLQQSNFPDIRFRAALTANQNILTTGTEIIFNDVEENVGGFYDPLTGYFQPNIPGLYLIECGLAVQSPGAANAYISYSIQTSVDGERRGADIFCVSTGVTPADSISCLVNLNGVDEYVFIKATAPAAASLAIGTPEVTNFSATLLRKLS